MVGQDDEHLQADHSGAWRFRYTLDGTLPTGVHQVSARGNASHVLATATFELLAGNGVAAPVVVSVKAGSVQQRSTIEVSSTRFEAGERVSV